MPSIVIGKVKGDKGDTGISPVVSLTKEDSILTISVTDVNGTVTESISPEENVQADWEEHNDLSDAYIKNKPTIPTYTLEKSNSDITLVGSDGTSSTVTNVGVTTVATSTEKGLMSVSDKTKLDGIDDNANNYTHPSYTSHSEGLYKVTVNSTGHVSNVTEITKDDIVGLGIPSENSHYSSKNVVGSSAAISNTTSALANGNVYLNSVENGAVTSSHKISGSGATTVITDTSGNIIIKSTDNNTTYDVMTAATADTDGTSGLVPTPVAGNQSKFLRGDGTWQTPTNTKNTAGSTNSSSKLYLVGATSQATNPQTYSHDTAYVGTNGCLYSNNKMVTTTVYSTDEPTSNLDTGTIWIG